MDTDNGEYAKPEDEAAPVIMYAGWDNEAGIVTALFPTEDEARPALAALLHEWAMLDLIPDRTRLREIHVHDNGTTRTQDPAADCPVCGALAGQALAAALAYRHEPCGTSA